MSFISTVKAFGLAAKAFAVVNSPFLLVGAGIVGTGLAVYHAFKAGEKAEAIISAETRAKGAPLSFKEKWHVTWKLVIPVSLEFALAVASTITGTVILNRRLHSMTALADAAIAARNEAQHKLDQITEKHPELKDELVTSVKPGKHFVKCGIPGNDVFHDPFLDIWWKSDYSAMQTAAAQFQESFFNSCYSTGEELYKRFHIEKIPPVASTYAWSSEDFDDSDSYDIAYNPPSRVPTVRFVTRPLCDENGKTIPEETVYEVLYFPSGGSFDLCENWINRRLDLQIPSFEPTIDCYSELDLTKRMKQCGVGI